MQRIEIIRDEYDNIKAKMSRMNNKTLQLTLNILDNSEGVSFEDFFQISRLLLEYDKKEGTNYD